jgi:hypothetical protein
LRRRCARAVRTAVERRRLGQPAVDLCAVELSARTAPTRPRRRRCSPRSACARSWARGRARDQRVSRADRRGGTNLLLPPKIAPNRLAADIVAALRGGAEDLYPGDIAQEWLERWRDNPKALERELAAGTM